MVEIEDQEDELNRREAIKKGKGGIRNSKNDLMLESREDKQKLDEEEISIRQ